MKIAAELSHFSSFCLILGLFSPPRAAVAFRQTKMQRLLLEKELVIGARGSYGLFCQTFLKGHGTFSFSFFSPPLLTRSSEPTRISSHRTWRNILDREADAAFWRKPPGALRVCALEALLRAGDVTRAEEGGLFGDFSHFSRHGGHPNFTGTIVCTNSATDPIGTGRTGDVIDPHRRN